MIRVFWLYQFLNQIDLIQIMLKKSKNKGEKKENKIWIYYGENIYLSL